MKKLTAALLGAIMMMAAPFCVHAAEAPIQNPPYLESIAFNNAQIDGGFRTGETYFTVTLDDPRKNVSLKSYTLSGDANVTVAYTQDEAQKKTGLTVTLLFDSGSVIYTFDYTNPPQYTISSNANLEDISCSLAEVRPQINGDDTAYKLYIPSDLTELTITPVTQDVNASAAPVMLTLHDGQEPEIPITVTASDGSTKKYTFDVKRVDKTCDEIKALMAQPDFESFVEGERFYEQPEFAVAAASAAGGLALIIIIAALVRRFAANPYDAEEKSFYSEK